jgi:alkyl sulfatase BDS1-like metallo-beta-lactamase superfamily hydrolase
MPNPQKLFDRLPVNLAGQPVLTAGLDAAFQFDISGPDGGQWYLKVVHGSVEVGRGLVERPTMTAHMSQALLTELAAGRISGHEAVRAGRIDLEGDATLEVYLGHFFRP